MARAVTKVKAMAAARVRAGQWLGEQSENLNHSFFKGSCPQI